MERSKRSFPQDDLLKAAKLILFSFSTFCVHTVNNRQRWQGLDVPPGRACRVGEKSHLRMYTRDMFLQKFYGGQKSKIFLVTFSSASLYKTTCL